MNLHDQLDQLIKEQQRTNELLEAMTGGESKSESGSSTKTTTSRRRKAPAKDKEPEITKQQANDAAISLKDAHGVTVVKEILKANGVDKLANMTDAQAPGVYKECLAKKEELDAGDDAGDDEDI